jgi:HPt (histidine-containing phosphotransfer) domain-containing protein
MQPASAQILDLAALKRNFADEMAFVARLLTKFEGRYPPQLESIQAALARGEGAEAGEVAHRLAGETGVFYSVAARETALRLEELARAGRVAEADAQLAALRTEIARLVQALRELSAS